MDGNVPTVDRDDDAVTQALQAGAVIASSGGSAGGPEGPDLLMQPDGKVIAALNPPADSDG